MNKEREVRACGTYRGMMLLETGEPEKKEGRRVLRSGAEGFSANKRPDPLRAVRARDPRLEMRRDLAWQGREGWERRQLIGNKRIQEAQACLEQGLQ